MNRREFLILAASAAVGAGCPTLAAAAAGSEQQVDLGPASAYAAEGVHTNLVDRGFFVVKAGKKVTVISSICPHKRCKLEAEPDRSFYCPCHGSTFTPAGKVTEGPAKTDLPIYPAFTDKRGHLIARVPAGKR